MKDDLDNGKVVFKWIMEDKHRKQSIRSYINKLHIDYIATRQGTDLADNSHGLFGYIKNTENVENMKLQNISKYVQSISNNNVNVFKTIISLREDDAVQKGLTNKEAWKSILKDRIRGIAEEYKIEFQNLEWVASFHMEKNHPHCHLVFWDISELNEYKKKNYVNFSNIRKHIAKGIFLEDLEDLYSKKNELKKDIANDVKEFNKQFKEKNEIINQLKEEIPSIYNNPILSYKFVDTGIEKINRNLEKLKVSIKNYKYQNQTKEVKKIIDETSNLILNSSRECLNTFAKYVKTEINIAEILGQTNTPEQLNRIKEKAENFMFNKIGNQILQFLKAEEYEKNKKEEYEQKMKEYEEKRMIKEQEFLEEQIDYLESQLRNRETRLISEVFYLLNQENISIGGRYARLKSKYSSLSKQAKREKYLEQRNASNINWFSL